MIVFSGVDCSGKSTQINLLKNMYSSDPVVFWARGGYTPLFSFLKKVLRKTNSSSIPKPGKSAQREISFSKPLIRKLWLHLALFDLFLCYVFWLRFLMLSGKQIICDRYLEDTLLDFKHNFPQENVQFWWGWRLLNLAAPQPQHRFLLLVPPKVSVVRGKQKNEPFPDSLETLEWRYEQYKLLAAEGDWIILDGQESVENVHQKIMIELGLCV
jgi:thymidylate kinase